MVAPNKEAPVDDKTRAAVRVVVAARLREVVAALNDPNHVHATGLNPLFCADCGRFLPSR